LTEGNKSENPEDIQTFNIFGSLQYNPYQLVIGGNMGSRAKEEKKNKKNKKRKEEKEEESKRLRQAG
jgi:hypothetical protein